MVKKNRAIQRRRADEALRKKLPIGVKLLRTLEGDHEFTSVAFDSGGEILASASRAGLVELWQVHTGKLLRTIEAGRDSLVGVAFHPRGETLASSGHLWEAHSGKPLRRLPKHPGVIGNVAFDPRGETLANGSQLLDASSGKPLRRLEGHIGSVSSVAFDPQGEWLATASHGHTVQLWEASSGKLLYTLEGHNRTVYGVAFDPHGTLATASGDGAVKLWNVRDGRLLRTLEGHTGIVDIVAFSPDGRLLASKSDDSTIRLWSCETWETVAVVPEPKHRAGWLPALAFHPGLPLLATAGPQSSKPNAGWAIHLWELDCDVLLRGRVGAAAAQAIHHTTGKIVLVGDHSVGKSALGYRMIHGRFERQESTHGQQFWVFPALGKRRADGTDCEAILWDFAGQPDYRLVHALFVDNADLALVLFDASDLRDPLHGVGFWL